jgi:hypothetical protein
MKIKLHNWIVAVAAMLLISLSTGFAADGKKLAGFIDSFTAAPTAVLRADGLDGKSDFGAGLDLGLNVNKSVSIHATALTYENEGWRSAAVDESEFYVRADLTKFSNERFIPYFKGGGVADWNEQDFGLGVGLGARVPIDKQQVVSLGGDYTIRAWLSRPAGKSTKESLARLFVEFKPPGW